MGMVIGLGMARLLSGVARIVQHPTAFPLNGVHLAWVASVLLLLVHFWWWEFSLYAIERWTFGKYLFLIGYSIVLFLMCAFLFPESMLDYRSYEDYFFSRRAWFFGLLAVSYLFDIADTYLKGPAHVERFGTEYFIRTPALIGLCLVAIFVEKRSFHAALVVAVLAYQVTWIFRLFDAIA
jgi:hypothetical protein